MVCSEIYQKPKADFKNAPTQLTARSAREVSAAALNFARHAIWNVAAALYANKQTKDFIANCYEYPPCFCLCPQAPGVFLSSIVLILLVNII